jgi:hypothetical protein
MEEGEGQQRLTHPKKKEKKKKRKTAAAFGLVTSVLSPIT